MKLECSWCRQDLGHREPLSNGKTTHGMCPRCLKSRIYSFMRQVRIEPPKPLSRLNRRQTAER